MSERPKLIFTVTNPRHIVLAAAIALAKAMHTGQRCKACTGQGLMYYPRTNEYGPCPHCDGFGQRLRST